MKKALSQLTALCLLWSCCLAEEADAAIRELTNIWLDDGHSKLYSGSYLSESRLVEG